LSGWFLSGSWHLFPAHGLHLIHDFEYLFMHFNKPYSNSSKFLITAAGLGAIYVLQSQKIGDISTTITIGCIVIAYYVADIYHKGKKNGGTK